MILIYIYMLSINCWWNMMYNKLMATSKQLCLWGKLCGFYVLQFSIFAQFIIFPNFLTSLGPSSCSVYLLSAFRQQPFTKIATFAKFAIFAKFANILRPFKLDNLFAIFISSTLAKCRQNRHFRKVRRFRQIRQHFGALLGASIYSIWSFRRQPWRNFAKFAAFARFANIMGLL